jgi:hypothetical protein
MQQEKYTFEDGRNGFLYKFYSNGPKGRIKKIVQFIRLKNVKTETYNLVLGDLKEAENRIDDLVTTNNGDRDKVLATVGAIIIHFIKKHPYASIFVAGSTPARNRLYQMGITKVLDEISIFYNVKGFIEGEWQSFQISVNYIAFLLECK